MIIAPGVQVPTFGGIMSQVLYLLYLYEGVLRPDTIMFGSTGPLDKRPRYPNVVYSGLVFLD